MVSVRYVPQAGRPYLVRVIWVVVKRFENPEEALVLVLVVCHLGLAVFALVFRHPGWVLIGNFFERLAEQQKRESAGRENKRAATGP